MNYQTIQVTELEFALQVTLNRPQYRNAMNLQMVQELRQVFAQLENNLKYRALILRGAEHHFCAGGDIKDMAHAGSQMDSESSPSSNPFYELNRAFGTMIEQANHLPQVVICLLEGAVMGGGFGLACISDLAIASRQCQMGLPETTLGVIPAQIAPFVVQRIGLTQARRLALLGQRISGEEAVNLGIAHTLCETPAEMEQQLKHALMDLKKCAPQANATTKALLHRVNSDNINTLLDQAANDFAQAVVGPEAMEGTTAFLQKRHPQWAK